MKTYTPTLDPAVLDRLREYADLFADEFPQSKPARWAGVYLQGLLLDGERKSIEPLSRRITLPDGLTSADPEQALQQFVNQSPWDEKAVLKRYRAHLAQTFSNPDGIFLFDDVSFPKQGTHSVGVQRQYCGALGKKANCQVAVSVHYVSPNGHYPLDLQLYLPDSWQTDTNRLDTAGVPKDQRRSRTKPEMALELLDRVRAERLPGRRVVADAGYGVSGAFRDGLEQRGLTYMVGVTGDFVVFAEQPQWDRPAAAGRGRPRTRPRLAATTPRPVALSTLAERSPRRRVTWREGTKGALSGDFAWVRVWPAQGWAWRVRRRPAVVAVDREAGGGWAGEVRLLEPAGGGEPDRGGASVEESVAGGARVSAVEGGTRTGSFRGPGLARVPSPHGDDAAGLRIPAAGAAPDDGRTGTTEGRPLDAGKKGDTQPVLTLPGVRRALQHLLMPLAKPDCTYCRTPRSPPRKE